MTRHVLLGSGCNEPYYPQMLPYLESVNQHNTLAEQFLVGVGWEPPAEHGFEPFELPLDKAIGRNRVHCVQHGAFLHAEGLRVDADDVIIYTDGGDVVMQRDFVKEEREQIQNIEHGTLMVGYNEGPNDTLLTEGMRLKPAPGWEKKYGEALGLPIYNTGVMIGTVSTFWALFHAYMDFWQDVDKTFDHYANIQWCISLALGRNPDLRVEVLSPAIHTHGHYPLPPGCDYDPDDHTVRYEGVPVVFRHNVPNRRGFPFLPVRESC